MYQLKIRLEGLPKTTNGNARRHWRALQGEAKKWHTAVNVACYGLRPNMPLARAKLILTRCSSQEPDFDGLVSSFKNALDGLKREGIIVDDKMSVIGQPDYRWIKAPIRKGYVTIEVFEVTDEQALAQGCAL